MSVTKSEHQRLLGQAPGSGDSPHQWLGSSFEPTEFRAEVIVLRKSQVQPFSERGKEVQAGLEFYRGRPMELRVAWSGMGPRWSLERTYAKRSAVLLPKALTYCSLTL
jgi:hypothetical protein